MTKTMSLEQVAEAMVAPGKGILAADESTGTIKKRFDGIKTENTEDNRRDYREMLFRSTDAMKNYVSGVILYDETIRQKAKDGTPLTKLIEASGVAAGHQGRQGHEAAAVQQGRDHHRGPRRAGGAHQGICRARRQVRQVARRCTTSPVLASRAMRRSTPMRMRWRATRRCASRAGIVPIVEPELLMDGGHDIDACEMVTEWILKEVYQQLYYANVPLEKTILKPNMVIAGKKSPKQASRQEVAERTVNVLKRCVPPAVPGIAFLSGGQSDEDATAHLHYMNQMGPLPWKLSFSYGRALQAAALRRGAGNRRTWRPASARSRTAPR